MITNHQIATNFCTCHDSTAVVPCAKFHSDHLDGIWAWSRWIFYLIWLVMEKLARKKHSRVTSQCSQNPRCGQTFMHNMSWFADPWSVNMSLTNAHSPSSSSFLSSSLGGLPEPVCRPGMSSSLGPRLANMACRVDRLGPATTNRHKCYNNYTGQLVSSGLSRYSMIPLQHSPFFPSLTAFFGLCNHCFQNIWKKIQYMNIH